jgi:hopanoid biosynthesis associated RND transporter like protein HpnN
MQPPREKWSARKLRLLTDAILDRPWRFVIPQLLLFVVCIVYAVHSLGFSAARGDLVSEKIKYQRDYVEFKREFQLPDAMIAMAESDSPEKNRLFVERLAAHLKNEPKFFANTVYKGDLGQMGRKGLLFLSQDSLDELSRICREDWPFIETFSKSENLNTALRSLNREFREGSPTANTGQDLAEAAPALRAFRRTIDQASRSITEPVSNTFPGIPTLFGDQNRLYLSFSAGRIYALVTHAASPAIENQAVTRLWELVAETRREVSGVNAGITGEPVLNHDEMLQATRDINLATIISFLLVALIFIIGFHEVSRPLLATFCLLVGIVFALGFTTLTVGRLNILSITLVPILVGVAIDFGVHFISRYEEELCRGHQQREALRRAFAFTGIGIITSGLTIAGAFFAMMLTDFKGIQEMGFVAGAGLLLCLLPMLTLLPLLLTKRDLIRRSAKPRRRCPPAWIECLWLNRPKLVLSIAAVVTVLSLSQFSNVHFDYNLLNLQSSDLPAVQTEQKLIRASSDSVLYGVVMADSLDQATDLQRRLEKLAPVSCVHSIVNLLTEDQSQKLTAVREIKQRINTLRLPPLDTAPPNLAQLNETLYALQGYLGWAPYFLDPESAPEAAAEIDGLRSSVIQFRSLINSATPETSARLAAFQQELFANVRLTLERVAAQDTERSLRAQDLPPFLRDRFISRSGKYLLQVHPKADLWQRPNQEEFLAAVRTVAPNVTGTVVQIHEYTTLLKNNFLNATGYAAAIISIILLIQFRRFTSVILAFLPVALGLCWTIGLMGWLGMRFNSANIMSLTLLTGIGISNGIHILIRFNQDSRPSILTKSTGKAILVSAFTTMAGFGSLMVARHQGIASLGIIMAMGTGLCLLSSLTVLPALLIALHRKTAQEPPEVHVPINIPARGMRPAESLLAANYKN